MGLMQALHEIMYIVYIYIYVCILHEIMNIDIIYTFDMHLLIKCCLSGTVKGFIVPLFKEFVIYGEKQK